MSAREELNAALSALTEGSAPLGTGPAPSWRPGYDQDEPIYLDVVRAMGIPGQDGPTGGDVVQGEIESDAEPEFPDDHPYREGDADEEGDPTP